MGARHWLGIDEAGYGPLLGPLVVAGVHWRPADGRDPGVWFSRHGVPVADSKRVHAGGNRKRLEAVALATLGWANGQPPATAGDLFALLGEGPEDRPHPWQDGLTDLPLPLFGGHPVPWPTAAGERRVSGRVIRPRHLDRARRRGRNKAAVLLTAVADLLLELPAAGPSVAICDHLGGRRYYGPALEQTWPGAQVAVREESSQISDYRVHRAEHEHRVAFVVRAESVNPLVAAASCVAKYAREVAMERFNRYWTHVVPGLAPTAGYPQDAQRWLAAVGHRHVDRWRGDLVRGWAGDGPRDAGQGPTVPYNASLVTTDEAKLGG